MINNFVGVQRSVHFLIFSNRTTNRFVHWHRRQHWHEEHYITVQSVKGDDKKKAEKR